MTDQLAEAIRRYSDTRRAVDEFEETEQRAHEERRQKIYGARKAAQRDLVAVLEELGLEGLSFTR